ncbi:cubilin-like [Panulirus ornatus]|uniref:cubilin-like n=1 Tax=Panulirus ornatus TaxID=150431 RepID=UPI003A86C752
MILQVMVVALVVGAALAWPIDPLDSYTRSEEMQLEASCGGVMDLFLDTLDVQRLTFNSSSHQPEAGNCTFHLRLAVKDLDMEKYGILVEGEVDMEESEDCSSSYLSIADEDDLEDELGHIDMFCGKQNIDFHTTEDTITIEMKLEDISTHESHFILIIKPHYLCGGLVDVETNITTPDYPKPYPRDIMCLWDIKAPIGFTISLNFKQFDIRPKKECKDYVGIESSHKFQTYCGTTLKDQTIEYETHEMVVVFRSNTYQGTYSGFICTIEFKKQMRNDILAKFLQ